MARYLKRLLSGKVDLLQTVIYRLVKMIIPRAENYFTIPENMV